MLRQLRAVLRSYRGRFVCLGLVYGSVLAGVGAALVGVHMVFHLTPGRDGLPTLTQIAASKPIPLFAWFAILAVIVLLHVFALGLQLRAQFVTYRSRLIPNWNLPHLVVAGALIVPFVTLLTAALAIHHMTDSWSLVSWVSAFGLLWFVALAGLSTGYHPIKMFKLSNTMIILLLFLGRSRLEQMFSIVVQQGRLIPAVTLVLVNAAWSISLVRRMVHFHEEIPEFDWKAAFGPSGKQTRHGTSGSQEPRLLGRILARFLRKLDAARLPLREDFLSYVRHFQLGASMAQLSLFMAVFMIPIYWVMDFFIAFPIGGNWGAMGTFIFLFLTFWIPIFSKNNSFQWIFMLPMRRRDVVIRYGSALFLSFLKGWLSFAVAIFIVEWLPLPWVNHGMPRLMPYLMSLAIQIAGFGGITLMLASTRESPARFIRSLVAVVFAFPLTFGLGELFSRITHDNDFVTRVTVAAAIVGIGLIGLSYRAWLETDLY